MTTPQNPYEAPEEISLRIEDKQLVPWRWIVPAVLLAGLGGAIIGVIFINGLIFLAMLWEAHHADRLVEFVGFGWPETPIIVAWFFAGVGWLSSAWASWNQRWRLAVVLIAIGAINCALALALRH